MRSSIIKVDYFFKFLNLFPLPVWLAMLLLPGHPLTERLSRSTTLFSLAGLNYVIALLIALKQGALKPSTLSDFNSLEGLRPMLGTRSGTLAVWGHLLALDLFTGAWIYRQSRRLQAPAWLRATALCFTFATGPFGLLIFLLWRLLVRGEILMDKD
jgi:hypothetical protein